MTRPPIPNTEIKIIDILFPVFALAFTSTRLTLRFRSGRFWWDDALAFGSAIFTAFMSAVTWIHYMDPTRFSKVTRIAAYYGVAESFYIALWLARSSILYSILRIVHESRTKNILNYASVAFACVCAFLCAQVFWVCEHQPHWKNKPQPQCALGLQVAVCQLLTDIASDLLLIVVPIKLFGRTNLGRGLKIRLLVIFSAAALTTIVSLVHAAYILEGLGEQAIISAIVEISVSLIVCNFVVVVPAFWRSCGMHEDAKRDGQCDRERTFKLSSVRFANPNRTHVSAASDTSMLTLSVQDQGGVMDVTGIVHDHAVSPSAEPPGRKSIRFEGGREDVLESPGKERRDRRLEPVDEGEGVDIPTAQGRKKSGRPNSAK